MNGALVVIAAKVRNKQISGSS